ncbi:hypothetical protein [Arhodomonas sp. AD133]|uniref:hypothetical protein n=1 Tax=Arhodomonas sp. AD133 TaxID=3415009 RepID=UPI003EBB0FC6
MDGRLGNRTLVQRRHQVMERDTGRTLGWVVNLSRSSLVLVGPSPVTEQVCLELVVWLPGASGDSHAVRLTARARWCRPSRYNNEFGVGLEIESVMPEDVHLLDAAVCERGAESSDASDGD